MHTGTAAFQSRDISNAGHGLKCVLLIMFGLKIMHQFLAEVHVAVQELNLINILTDMLLIVMFLICTFYFVSPAQYCE